MSARAHPPEEAKKAFAEANKEAKEAFTESSGLSRENRLWIEAQYRYMNGEWDKARKTYKTLFDLHPDNLEYGLNLVGYPGLSRGYIGYPGAE